MRLIQRPSPNHDERTAPVDMLVLHYTGMASGRRRWTGCAIRPPRSRRTTPSTKTARFTPMWRKRTAPGTPACRTGQASIMSTPAPSASSWSIRDTSIGYRAFPRRADRGADRTERVISFTRHAIAPSHVLGHSDVAPARKEDPGELFPWRKLADEGIGLWPQASHSDLDAAALTRYGYDPNAPLDKVITAFQRHFRPAKLDGKWDAECAGLLASLLRSTSV